MLVRPLPARLMEDWARFQRFQIAVLSCIEAFYRDRVAPTVQEVQHRLHQTGWSKLEAKAALALCAQDSHTYRVLPPSEDKLACIMLRIPPAWFKGWVDSEGPDSYPTAVWQAMEKLIARVSNKLHGGILEVAYCLQMHAKGLLQHYSLGTFRHLVALSLGQRELLTYDAKHGSNILACPSLMERIVSGAAAERGTAKIEEHEEDPCQHNAVTEEQVNADAFPAFWEPAAPQEQNAASEMGPAPKPSLLGPAGYAVPHFPDPQSWVDPYCHAAATAAAAMAAKRHATRVQSRQWVQQVPADVAPFPELPETWMQPHGPASVASADSLWYWRCVERLHVQYLEPMMAELHELLRATHCASEAQRNQAGFRFSGESCTMSDGRIYSCI